MEAETRYAKNGDVHIAYRVFGDGPRDIILVPGTVSHVELFWELPVNEYLLRRLASFARVIVFDKRGQGLSDRVAEPDARRAGQRRAGGDGCGRVEARDGLRMVGRRPDVSKVRRDVSRARLEPRPVRLVCVDQGASVVRQSRGLRAIP